MGKSQTLTLITMLRTPSPAEVQTGIACTLRQELKLNTFTKLEPESKRMNLESASAFLTNPDARPTDKRAIVAFLELLATVEDLGVGAIAQSIVDQWHNPL